LSKNVTVSALGHHTGNAWPAPRLCYINGTPHYGYGRFLITVICTAPEKDLPALTAASERGRGK
jgi:hypothetical protein